MTWTKHGAHAWKNGNYEIHQTTKGWDLWNYAKRPACLARSLLLSEAMRKGEELAKSSTDG
jgi:hypothetical protein